MPRAIILSAAVLAMFLASGLTSGDWSGAGAADMDEVSSSGNRHEWIHVERFVAETDLSNVRERLGNTTLWHPSPGRFTLQVAIDPSPTTTRIGWYDEANGTEVSETPTSLLLRANEFESRGWFTAWSGGASGLLMTPNGDIEIEGTWQDGGLLLNLTAIEPRMWRLGTGDYNED